MNRLFFVAVSSSIVLFSMNQQVMESGENRNALQTTDTIKVPQKENNYKVEFYRQIALRTSGYTTYKRTSLNIGTFSVSLTNAGDGYYNIDGTEYYVKFLDDKTPAKNKGMLDVHSGEGENNDGIYTEDK